MLETDPTLDAPVTVEISDPAKTGIGQRPPVPMAGGPEHFVNLATSLDVGRRALLAAEMLRDINAEDQTRDKWLRRMEEIEELMALGDRGIGGGPETKDFARTTNPLLLASIMKFQSRMFTETVPVSGPVSVEPMAQVEKLPNIEAMVEQVKEFANDLLIRRLPSWESDHDRTILNIAKLGCSFKKIYADPVSPCGLVVEQIDPQNYIMTAHAKSVRARAPATHKVDVSTDTLLRRMEAGEFIMAPEIIGLADDPADDGLTEKRREQSGIEAYKADRPERHTLYERQVMLILEEDPHPKKLPRPYIATIHEQGMALLALRRNWAAGDPTEEPIETIAHYVYLPGESQIYALGLGQALRMITRGLSEADTRALEAAFLQNHPGGIMLGTMGIRSEAKDLESGTWVPVDAPVDDVRKALQPFPFQGASTTLLAQRDKMEANGRELAGSLSTEIAELTNQNTPVGTTVAALDEALIIPSSVQGRIYKALAAELELIRKALIQRWPSGPVQIGDGPLLPDASILQMVRFVPAMPPGSTTRHQRIARAQTVMQAAQTAPQLHDMRQVYHRFYSTIGVEEIDELLPPPTAPQPADIVTEGANAMTGKPLKAGWAQDHMAHIAGHMAQAQIVQGQQSMAGPGAQVVAALQAHCAEHLAFYQAVQVCNAMGIPLEALNQGIPPEVEMRIAPMMAQALQALAQQMQPQQQPDPMLAIEQVKQEGAMAREQLKAQTTMAVKGIDLTAKREDIQAKRAIATADDAAALEIARMKQGQPSADAGAEVTAGAGAQAGADVGTP